jgi:hypothetical protein
LSDSEKNICADCGTDTDAENGPCSECRGFRIVPISFVKELLKPDFGDDWRDAFKEKKDE